MIDYPAATRRALAAAEQLAAEARQLLATRDDSALDVAAGQARAVLAALGPHYTGGRGAEQLDAVQERDHAQAAGAASRLSGEIARVRAEASREIRDPRTPPPPATLSYAELRAAIARAR